MTSALDKLKGLMKSAVDQLRSERGQINRQIANLTKQRAAIDLQLAQFTGKPNGHNGRTTGSRNTRPYGDVRGSVLEAIKASKGIKPAQIVEKTGLASPQVHNALTGLKQSKLVKTKDGLYVAA